MAVARALLLLLVVALPRAEALAQFEPVGPATDYVSWTARIEPARVAPGDTVYLVLDATVAQPWKVYALDASLPPLSEGPRPYGVDVVWDEWPQGIAAAGAPEQSAPEIGRDPNFDKILGWFHGTARFAWPLAVSADAPAGEVAVTGSVRFQICNDDRGICLPPTPVPFAAVVVADPGCSDGTSGEDAGCELDEASFDEMMGSGPEPAATQGESRPAPVSRSMLGFLLLALGAGLASLLTPCVFPMVPLTVSYFTKHADSRGEAVRMASVFGGAIVVTFTLLGILMAALVGAAGAQTIAANPWVNLFIALVLIGFALSLLGLYELRVPNALLNFTNRQSTKRGGAVGVLFMGLTLTLVSFSCTAPFVGGLLAAAAGGTWAWPMLGMVVYSAAFALPFVLLALFPRALSTLPKSGAWMNVLKVVLGFVELAASLKFLSNADLVWGWGILSRPLAIAITVVILFVAGVYLLGKLRLSHDEPVPAVGVGRLLAAVGFIALGLYMLPGLFGAPLNSLDAFLPPRQGTDVSLLAVLGPGSVPRDDEEWIVDDIEAAVDFAGISNRPLFIDFTGYTCTNCREMEANVFPSAPVRERLGRDFVLLRLYTDGLERGTEFQRYQLQLTGTVALPTYAVLAADGRTLLAVESGIMSRDAFVRFLDGASSAFSRL
jgi:thiol:disulfide interchange protein DsbD